MTYMWQIINEHKGCMTFDNKQVNITILRTQELNNLKMEKIVTKKIISNINIKTSHS